MKSTYLLTKWNYRLAVGDDVPTQQLLSSRDAAQIQEYLEGYERFAIDEAQYVPEIGHALKINVDWVPGIRVIATGSSSFERAGQSGEPRTGRKVTLTLYPISQGELLSRYNKYDLKQDLEDPLIVGSYPQVVNQFNPIDQGDDIGALWENFVLMERMKKLEYSFQPYRVLAIPTLLTFRKWELLGRVTGAQIERNFRRVFEVALQGRTVRLPLRAFDRTLRLGTGAALLAIGLTTASWPLLLNGGLAAFLGVHDRCPKIQRLKRMLRRP